MSAVTNGMPALVVTVPGAADVIWLACPVQGSCVGVTNLLNGGHGDYSLATFTLSYTGPRAAHSSGTTGPGAPRG